MQNSTEPKPKVFLYPKLSCLVRGAVYEVYKALGPFHKENVYSKALELELKRRKIPFIREKILDVVYKRKKVGVYRPDFLIDDKIILEIKAVPVLPKIDEKQLYYYLAGTKYRLGFLINFGAKNGVYIHRRVVG